MYFAFKLQMCMQVIVTLYYMQFIGKNMNEPWQLIFKSIIMHRHNYNENKLSGV